MQIVRRPEARATIRNCRELLVLRDAGYFVQERREPVAAAALRAFAEQEGRR